MHILILGCGFTGERVAARFLARGAQVTATTRTPQRLSHLRARGAKVVATSDFASHVQSGMLVLHSIPPEGSVGLLEPLRGLAERIVYLSSTTVYGDAAHVDETTPAQADAEHARARLAVERSIAEGPWQSLILRPAAIYGPGRGVQESIKRGAHSVSDRYVSRVHVEDLATHAEAALLSQLTGAYPVADEEPCTSWEIAQFCSSLLNVPVMSAAHDPAARPPASLCVILLTAWAFPPRCLARLDERQISHLAPTPMDPPTD